MKFYFLGKEWWAGRVLIINLLNWYYSAI